MFVRAAAGLPGFLVELPSTIFPAAFVESVVVDSVVALVSVVDVESLLVVVSVVGAVSAL